MSNRYKGGVISATPPTTTGGESGTASGAWTLEQQMQLTAAGLWPIQPLPKYIEDVFSTWLYTGNGSTQTITNGIDLSGQGGLVWGKNRDANWSHYLADTARGTGKFLESNTTGGNTLDSTSLTAFNANGFSIGNAGAFINNNGVNYVSWTFREQPKFFDIVTYSGNGSTQTINHNLGSEPGCIIIKVTNEAGSNWWVWHRGDGTTFRVLNLDRTSASYTSSYANGDSVLSAAPTSTTFSVKNTAADLYGTNQTGGTYVAYLFAHDAGGFGLTGTDNVISCGSFTGSASNVNVSLGYEPQWVMIKRTNSSDNWRLYDNMRGMTASNGGALLYADTSGAEQANNSRISVNATGFGFVDDGANTNIYIAIRRGPMKVPTSGTSVFSLDASSAGGSGGLLGATTASDLVINSQRDPAYNSPFVFIDRLRGVGQVNTGATTKALYSSNTNAETTVDTTSSSSTAEGVNGAYLYSAVGKSSAIRTVQQGPGGSVAYNLIRAPSFMDVVCYTGTGSATTQTHNLGVVPELMIIKSRTNGLQSWYVYSSAIWGTGIGGTAGYDGLRLDSTAAAGQNNAVLNSTQPTASVFSLGTLAPANESAATFVNYLFATCAGVSKVGSYLGTGATQTIACGFTGGARFVLIKRADSTGDWYVWDSARGIIAGNDPYLLLNSTAAEVTNTDYVDTAATGFEISSTAPAAINANGGTYIFLAIA